MNEQAVMQIVNDVIAELVPKNKQLLHLMKSL